LAVQQTTTVHECPPYLISPLSTVRNDDDVDDDDVTPRCLATSSQTNVNTWPESTSSLTSPQDATLCSVNVIRLQVVTSHTHAQKKLV